MGCQYQYTGKNDVICCMAGSSDSSAMLEEPSIYLGPGV